MSCDACRRLICEDADDKELARRISSEFPHGVCESHSVGSGSPGIVEDNEVLVRVIISPRDYDPATNMIAQKPFEKVFANGLSVMRSIGSDNDFIANAEDGLWSKPDANHRQIMALCSVSASEIREIREGNPAVRLFRVYDQTVSRPDPSLPPVPTHAGIFQDQIAYDIAGARQINKDRAVALFDKFAANLASVESFRGGLYLQLNSDARRGRFKQQDNQ